MSLDNPSDLFFAIGEAIMASVPAVDVGNYDEFDDSLKDASVLIEFERAMPAIRDNSGRYAHRYAITLHCVVGRWRRWAPLEAINLASVVERIADANGWGLPGHQIDMPEDLHTSPSIFKNGAQGYEAWGVSFNQTIYLGESLLPDDPIVSGVMIANQWQVDIDDPGQYTPLNE